MSARSGWRCRAAPTWPSCRGVFTYRSNGAGQLIALRAYWEYDKLKIVEA
jgi:hypothetical protein